MSENTISLRERLHYWFEHAEGPIGKALTVAIVLLVIISIVSLPFELLSYFEEYHFSLFVLEFVIVVIFTIEYGLRVFAAPKRLAYVFSWSGVIDLFSILPFYLAMIDLRLLRLLRLARLARVMKLASIAAMQERSRELNLLANEKIEHVAHKHPILFYLNLIPALVFLLIGLMAYALFQNEITLGLLGSMLVFALIFFSKAWFGYAHDVIYLTNFRIIILNRRLLGKDSREVYYDNVVDVRSFHPNALAYLLGYGSLVIQTSAGTDHIHANQILHHEDVVHRIDTKKKPAS